MYHYCQKFTEGENIMGNPVQSTQPVGTTEIWKLKHSMARAFYSTFREDILKLWTRIKGEQSLRPSIWSEFVESEAFWKMGWEKFCSLSQGTRDMFGDAELMEDGMEALTQEGEVYFLVPLMYASVPLPEGVDLLEVTMTEGKKAYCYQQLLKTVLLYAFADVYRKEFTVQFYSHPAMTVDQETIFKPFFLKQ